MRTRCLGLLSAAGVAIGLGGITVLGQSGAGTPESHIEAAKAAAGQDHAFMYNTLCVEELGRMGAPPAPAPARGTPPPAPPARSTWHAEPLKVFDNVYWVGQTEFSAWAITTSDGIILMDAIYDYSVRDEVVDGLKKLGLNPASIKYAVIAHGHADHAGGAQILQELYGTKIILSADDWDLLDRTAPPWKPNRDIVATDGMKLTLGDTTVTLYITPGHTKGTISAIIPVKDGGKPYVAAYWGGTMFNWIRNRSQYIAPGTPEKFWFDSYAGSAARFRDIAAKAGAEVLMSNHTNFDGSKVKMPQMALRKPGDPFHPFVVGKDSVQRYLTTVGECARAGSLRVK